MSISKESIEKKRFLTIQVSLTTQVFITVVVCKNLKDQVLQTKVNDMTRRVIITIETVQTMQSLRSQRRQKQRVIVMFYQEKQMNYKKNELPMTYINRAAQFLVLILIDYGSMIIYKIWQCQITVFLTLKMLFLIYLMITLTTDVNTSCIIIFQYQINAKRWTEYCNCARTRCD